MKLCTRCGELKPLGDFYKRMGGKDGRRGDCKLCVLRSRRQRYERDGETLRSRVRKYQAQYPERVAASQATWRASEAGVESKRKSTRNRYLEQAYGITSEEYDEMFAQQGGRCAVCRSDDPVRYWTVDHDHLTGTVRGILCWHCNIGLGHFRDDIANLIAAADYLVRTQAPQQVEAR